MSAAEKFSATAGKSCPSAPLAAGNTIIGALGQDGRIHNFRTSMVADDAFVAAANRQGPAERHIRSAGHCVEGGCKQWTGSACGVVERVLNHLKASGLDQDMPLQPCVIRATCRWFDQRGALACNGCSYVVTEMREAKSSGQVAPYNNLNHASQ